VFTLAEARVINETAVFCQTAICFVTVRRLMSALGQKQTSRSEITMSALPPKADITGQYLDVRFVPKADIDHSIQSARWRYP
jgi:hypothetical protein